MNIDRFIDDLSPVEEEKVLSLLTKKRKRRSIDSEIGRIVADTKINQFATSTKYHKPILGLINVEAPFNIRMNSFDTNHFTNPIVVEASPSQPPWVDLLEFSHDVTESDNIVSPEDDCWTVEDNEATTDAGLLSVSIYAPVVVNNDRVEGHAIFDGGRIRKSFSSGGIIFVDDKPEKKPCLFIPF